MTLLNQIVSLIGTMAPMWSYCLNFVFALCFLASVPLMIYSAFRRR